MSASPTTVPARYVGSDERLMPDGTLLVPGETEIELDENVVEAEPIFEKIVAVKPPEAEKVQRKVEQPPVDEQATAQEVDS